MKREVSLLEELFVFLLWGGVMLDVGDEAQGLVNVRQILHWDIFLTQSEQGFS